MLESSQSAALTRVAAGGASGRGPSALCRDAIWEEALELMKGAPSAAVVSGFFIRAASAPETDGPTGALSLARALLRRETDAFVWTDSRCLGVFKACARAMGFPEERVADVSGDIDGTETPPLLIYVERLGRAPDGAYYDMCGNDISDVTSPLDSFALRGTSRVIGVGDGGNEVGMGNYRNELSERMRDYAPCLTVVGADVCVPADVSNWGAYALSAALSLDAGEWLGQTEAEEMAMMDAICGAGAVDGISRVVSASVDGFDMRRQVEVLSSLRGIR